MGDFREMYSMLYTFSLTTLIVVTTSYSSSSSPSSSSSASYTSSIDDSSYDSFSWTRRMPSNSFHPLSKVRLSREIIQGRGQAYPAFANGNYEPYFATTETDVKAPAGGRAYLRCQIMQLGDRTVSWVRQNDLQILTAGNDTYTSDGRFRAVHSPLTNDWTLEIRETQFSDSGVYECQVPSLNDNKLSLSVTLRVVELKTEILEGPLIVSRKGGDVKLTCAINYSPSADASSSHVLWSRDGKLLNYDTSGSWFVWSEVKKIKTKRKDKDKRKDTVLQEHLINGKEVDDGQDEDNEEVEEDGLQSHLLIKSIDSSKTGNYSCQMHAPTIDTSHSTPAHVVVHVLNGQTNPAAIHGGNNHTLMSVASSGGGEARCTRRNHHYLVLLSMHLLLLLLLVMMVYEV